MKSYQNLVLLQNLYRLKALGFSYTDPVVINQKNPHHLPDSIPSLNQMIAQCHLCDLSKSRRQPMAGFGNPAADVMIIDGSVSMAEDESNAYFVGRSGTSLRKMIENVLGLDHNEIYLTHAVKCKPIGTQTPSPSEWNSCKPYLLKQIELVKPKVVVTLGPDAYAMVTGDDGGFERVRGQKVKYGNHILVPIYHPQFLLRNPSLKKETLYDLNTIKSCL